MHLNHNALVSDKYIENWRYDGYKLYFEISLSRQPRLLSLSRRDHEKRVSAVFCYIIIMIVIKLLLIVATFDIRAQYTIPPFLHSLQGLVDLHFETHPHFQGTIITEVTYACIKTTFEWKFGQEGAAEVQEAAMEVGME
jgi:hypothetical protein